MRKQAQAALLVAVILVGTAAAPLAASAFATPHPEAVSGTQAQTAEGTATPEANVTGSAMAAGSGGFDIVSLSAPDSAAPDSVVTVVAVVENPSSSLAVEPVEFRVGGDVVERQRVVLYGNETYAVEFTLDTEGLAPGEYVHGVYTESAGRNARLTISESFVVDDLDAPGSAFTGSTVSVAANVTNPNDFETTQDVTFRFGGVPLTTETLTLEAGETRQFLADVDTTGVTPDTYLHGVFARDTGQVDTIDIAAFDGASVTFSDQSSDGTTVTVDAVVLPDGGFVTIHDSSLLGGAIVDSVVGTTGYLEPGTYESVTVTLFDVPGASFDESALAENETLVAMAHRDTNGNQTYDFVATRGQVDGPYRIGRDPVVDDARVTVPAPETPSENATETETPGETDTQSDTGTATTGDNTTDAPETTETAP